MSTTTYTHEQRDESLRRAQEIRRARAQLSKKIYEGEITVARVLSHTPPEASSWRIGQLLCAQRKWGRVRCVRLLSRTGISETKPVRALTDSQRRLLATALGGSTAAGEGER